MSRLSEVFRSLRSRGESALVAYITAGDPDLETTVTLAETLQDTGADIIELGIPYSDPMADGATIQRASVRALKAGATLRNIIDAVAQVRSHVNVPVVFMSYYNLIYQFGEAKFIERAHTAGVDGVIVPDLPPEESSSLRKLGREADFNIIYLLAPTSSPERVRRIARVSSGFIYYVSLTGVTGERKSLSAGLKERVCQVKTVTRKPVVVGFGISTEESVREVSGWADGVVVGSAIVKIIEERMGRNDLQQSVGDFVRRLKAATKVVTKTASSVNLE